MDHNRRPTESEGYELDNTELCEAISVLENIPEIPDNTAKEAQPIQAPTALLDPEPDKPLLEPESEAGEEPAPPAEPMPHIRPRKKRKGLGFYGAVIIAGALVVAMLLCALLLPRETDLPQTSLEPEATPEPAPSTMYITKIDKPGAPATEYIPPSGDVVIKTPLYWGVDVSEHQLDIDWQTTALTGADFAMIRAGYRGYTQGEMYTDEYFVQNIQGATEAGMDVGVYFFSQATTVEEAVEEARYVLELIEPYDVTYPVVFDWEIIDNASARTYDMTAQEVTDCALAFCETVAYGGYTPMIYFGQMASLSHFELERLQIFDFWLADYTQSPSFHYDYQMWQYTNQGSIDGIQGDVDVNYCFSEYAAVPTVSPSAAAGATTTPGTTSPTESEVSP